MVKFIERAAQGEVNINVISEIPDDVAQVLPVDGKYIIGHSESGNCHVIDAKPGTKVFSRKDHKTGMDILYAIIEEPSELRQTAAVPHETISLDKGMFCFRNSREYDPFFEQARRVSNVSLSNLPNPRRAVLEQIRRVAEKTRWRK